MLRSGVRKIRIIGSSYCLMSGDILSLRLLAAGVGVLVVWGLHNCVDKDLLVSAVSGFDIGDA